ncbi:fused MFS/spermidine synthase [Longimicrobium terrae]|uniref:Spermidine synthase n=1 Tax=Longimicrobium terrae TaxID=1639882 RepID=A0A841GRA6_9BACT|nr:spermidine synthase [Longimicrobium terrae]MBB6069650.1 spermidine synthase [Longimicrobium terrae]NNC31139.1 fused MFS/spermidine synthase [Longimicrobium terrae]
MSTQQPAPAAGRFSIMPPPPPPVPPAVRVRSAAVVATFTASVFLSAFLLFLIQPMFGKMVLPLLGGSPAVWNTCMLFFQAALLGGYGYAHLTTRHLSARSQAILHLCLLACTLLLLPITVAGRAPQGGAAPIPWLLGTMLVTVGPPFFVLAGTGPMLQRWFAHSGHRHAADPYPLYAASNLGSMISLLAYPALMEPRMRLAGQSVTWGWGFGVLMLGIAGCTAWIWRTGRAPAPAAADSAPPAAVAGAPVTTRERAIWVFLAFVPSTYLLGLTTYITTDLSPVPLLWVLPLALYLLTFTLAFARRPFFPHEHMVRLQPVVLAVVVLLLLSGFVEDAIGAIPLHLGGLFITSLVCHGELARRRPAVSHLTEFYLWISVGGVLGGIFNVLVAPVIFNNVYEYSLALVLACLARPWPEALGWKKNLWAGLRAAGLALALLFLASQNGEVNTVLFAGLALLLVGLVTTGLGRTPVWLAACLGAVMLYSTAKAMREPGVLLEQRSFYGRFRILKAGGSRANPAGWHTMRHGSTLHGAQNLTPALRREPITYYLRRGPMGQMFAATEDRAGRRRVAVVGLGTGTLAAYARAGEDWTFYEIDPHVRDMATDRRYFSYYSDAPATKRVVLGDARLSLAQAAGKQYDMILLDAFSSDAIPVHLLTREAMTTYMQRLAPGGILGIHISNRYLNLEPVVAALARERGLAAVISTGPTGKRERYESIASWIAVARSENDLMVLHADSRWKPLDKRAIQPWTDDYSSLLSVFQP